MNEIELARKTYAHHVQSRLDIPAELKNALKTHECVPLFIDNLARELKKIHGINKDNIEYAVRNLTDLFIQNVIKKRDFDMQSEAQKLVLKEQQLRKERLKKEVDALESKGADYVLSEEFQESI